MPTEQETRIAGLLRDAESAHGGYETNVLGGVRDEDWAGWYARYLLDNGLENLLPAFVTTGRKGVAVTLMHLDEAFRREPTPGEWPEFYARSLLSGS